MMKLLSSFPMEIHEGIYEVRDASTNVEKVDYLIVKVEVKQV